MPVENLIISKDTQTGMALLLTWTVPPTIDYEGVLIRYSTTANPATATDGFYLAEIYKDDAPNNYFLHNGIQVNTRYYYTLFSFDGTGTFDAGVMGDSITRDGVAPSPVETFSTTITEKWKVDLSWTIPDDPDYEGVLIKYSTLGYPDEKPDILSEPPYFLDTIEETGISDGRIPKTELPNDSFTHFCSSVGNCQWVEEWNDWYEGYAPVPGKTHYYAIWVYDKNDNFSTPMYASATPTLSPPIIDEIRPGNGSAYIRFHTTYRTGWNNTARDPWLTHFVVVRKVGSAPTSLTDGERIRTIYESNYYDETQHQSGGGCSSWDEWIMYYINDHEATNDQENFYGIFSCSHGDKGCSEPAVVSITPDSTITEIDFEDFESRSVGTYPSVCPQASDWCARDADATHGLDRWAVINDPNECENGARCLWCAKYDDNTTTIRSTPIYRTSNHADAYFEKTFDLSTYTYANLSYYIRVHVENYQYFYLMINNQELNPHGSTWNYFTTCHNANSYQCGCDSDYSPIDYWREYNLDLSPWAGNDSVTIQFRWQHIRSGYAENYYEWKGVYLDDVRVEGW